MPVGTRVLGHRLHHERWYLCAITGHEYRESETVVPEHPHPQAGLRVWVGALDELDRDTERLINGPPDLGHDKEERD